MSKKMEYALIFARRKYYNRYINFEGSKVDTNQKRI